MLKPRYIRLIYVHCLNSAFLHPPPTDTHTDTHSVLVPLTFIPFPPGSWTLLPKLICHHYCNQKAAPSWSLMYSSHWPAPHISLSLYIPCIILKYFSTPPDFLSSPLGSLSYAFSRQSVTPFVLLCISSLNTLKENTASVVFLQPLTRTS